MASVPKATTKAEEVAIAVAGGLDTVCVIAPSRTQADAMPRLFGNANAIKTLHGYCEGVEYAAFHAEETGKSILYVAVPIAVEGVIGRVNKAGNTGSAVATVAALAGGVLSEHIGRVRVKTGGTVGTDQIVLEFTLDDGYLYKTARLGTANSYTFPDVNAQLTLGAGTLVAGDEIIAWVGTGPKCDATGINDAFTNLRNQARAFRSVMLIGDVLNSTEAQTFLDRLNAYETVGERFVYGRAGLRDRLPVATMSKDIARMTAGTSLTFAEVGATGDTITRAGGSWLAEGFAIGDTVVITGTSSNNLTAVIQNLTATVMTFNTEDLAAEVTANATIVGRPTLTFAEVGGTGDTITRNRGSWIVDGFRVGDRIVVTGSGSNNITAAQGLATVTATVLTLGTDDLAAEVVSTQNVVVKCGETKAVWMATLDAAFAAIDGATAWRIDLGAGRGRKASPLTDWNHRRSVQWAASLREYQNDLHVPVWRKSLGNTGWMLTDAVGNLVEWDDRKSADGGAGSAARFTTFRTYGNGPGGAYITQSLTRSGDGTLMSQTHNLAVTNLACTIIQIATENFIGRDLDLNEDGTATSDSLTTLESEVNQALELGLLTNRGQGKRASLAVWTASRDDVFNVPEALLTGKCRLQLKGTVHSVDTRVRVLSAGQA